MIEVIFTYDGNLISIQCQKGNLMKDIIDKFATKLELDINNFIFLYGGKLVNTEIPLSELDNQIGNDINRVNIVVYDKDNYSDNKNGEKLEISKVIICPECNEMCRIKINNYKINLYGCRNNHEIKIYLLMNFIKHNI